jgi:hypothetical protein
VCSARFFVDDLHPARPGQIHRKSAPDPGQPHDLPVQCRKPRQERDAVGGGGGLLVTGRGHPGGSWSSGDRGDKPVAHRAHRLGRDGSEIRHSRAGLVEVDFLQSQHVSVQLPHTGSEPIHVNLAVVRGAAVQDVERRHPHGY